MSHYNNNLINIIIRTITLITHKIYMFECKTNALFQKQHKNKSYFKNFQKNH